MVLDELDWLVWIPKWVFALVFALAFVGQMILIVVLDGVTLVISTFAEWESAEFEVFERSLDLDLSIIDPRNGGVSKIATDV